MTYWLLVTIWFSPELGTYQFDLERFERREACVIEAQMRMDRVQDNVLKAGCFQEWKI